MNIKHKRVIIIKQNIPYSSLTQNQRGCLKREINLTYPPTEIDHVEQVPSKTASRLIYL